MRIFVRFNAAAFVFAAIHLARLANWNVGDYAGDRWRSGGAYCERNQQ